MIKIGIDILSYFFLCHILNIMSSFIIEKPFKIKNFKYNRIKTPRSHLMLKSPVKKSRNKSSLIREQALNLS